MWQQRQHRKYRHTPERRWGQPVHNKHVLPPGYLPSAKQRLCELPLALPVVVCLADDVMRQSSLPTTIPRVATGGIVLLVVGTDGCQAGSTLLCESKHLVMRVVVRTLWSMIFGINLARVGEAKERDVGAHANAQCDAHHPGRRDSTLAANCVQCMDDSRV